MSSVEKPPSDKPTWKQVDAFVDTGRGSYSDAFDYFGVTPDEVEPEPDDSKLIDKSPEIAQTKKPRILGVCVNLGERALFLSEALNHKMVVRKLEGLIHTKEKKEDFDNIFQTVEKKNQSEKEGDLAFFMAFGGFEMIKAGYPIHKVDSLAQDDADRFLAEYAGNANSNKRAKSRKVWRKQIERVNEQQKELDEPTEIK
jgi:hypothetical protein